MAASSRVAGNHFPARRLGGKRGTAGEWIQVYQQEQERRFQAVLAPHLTDYDSSRLRGSYVAGLQRPPNSPFVARGTSQPLDGFLLMERGFVTDPVDLYTIDVSGLGLTEVKEDELQHFLNLTCVKAGENDLELEPFRNLTALTELCLPLNGISGVVVGKNMFTSLEVLDLSCNCLDVQALADLGRLPELVKLDVSGNDFRLLPTSMIHPILDVKNKNTIEETTVVSQRFSKLEELHLSNNLLSDASTFALLASLQRLEKLYLDGNSFQSVPQLRLFVPSVPSNFISPPTDGPATAPNVADARAGHAQGHAELPYSPTGWTSFTSSRADTLSGGRQEEAESATAASEAQQGSEPFDKHDSPTAEASVRQSASPEASGKESSTPVPAAAVHDASTEQLSDEVLRSQEHLPLAESQEQSTMATVETSIDEANPQPAIAVENPSTAQESTPAIVQETAQGTGAEQTNVDAGTQPATEPREDPVENVDDVPMPEQAGPRNDKPALADAIDTNDTNATVVSGSPDAVATISEPAHTLGPEEHRQDPVELPAATSPEDELLRASASSTTSSALTTPVHSQSEQSAPFSAAAFRARCPAGANAAADQAEKESVHIRTVDSACSADTLSTADSRRHPEPGRVQPAVEMGAPDPENGRPAPAEPIFPFPSLTLLDLSGNKIAQQECVVHVNQWPVLKHINVCGNPFVAKMRDSTCVLLKELTKERGIAVQRSDISSKAQPSTRQLAVKQAVDQYMEVDGQDRISAIPRRPVEERIASERALSIDYEPSPPLQLLEEVESPSITPTRSVERLPSRPRTFPRDATHVETKRTFSPPLPVALQRGKTGTAADDLPRRPITIVPGERMFLEIEQPARDIHSARTVATIDTMGPGASVSRVQYQTQRYGRQYSQQFSQEAKDLSGVFLTQVDEGESGVTFPRGLFPMREENNLSHLREDGYLGPYEEYESGGAMALIPWDTASDIGRRDASVLVERRAMKKQPKALVNHRKSPRQRKAMRQQRSMLSIDDDAYALVADAEDDPTFHMPSHLIGCTRTLKTLLGSSLPPKRLVNATKLSKPKQVTKAVPSKPVIRRSGEMMADLLTSVREDPVLTEATLVDTMKSSSIMSREGKKALRRIEKQFRRIKLDSFTEGLASANRLLDQGHAPLAAATTFTQEPSPKSSLRLAPSEASRRRVRSIMSARSAGNTPKLPPLTPNSSLTTHHSPQQ